MLHLADTTMTKDTIHLIFLSCVFTSHTHVKTAIGTFFVFYKVFLTADVFCFIWCSPLELPTTVPPPPPLPSAPLDFVVTDVRSRSVKLLWSSAHQAGLSPVTYIVEYKNVDKNGQWIQVVSALKQDLYVVRNLEPNTRYIFAVRAASKDMKSARTESGKKRTRSEGMCSLLCILQGRSSYSLHIVTTHIVTTHIWL